MDVTAGFKYGASRGAFKGAAARGAAPSASRRRLLPATAPSSSSTTTTRSALVSVLRDGAATTPRDGCSPGPTATRRCCRATRSIARRRGTKRGPPAEAPDCFHPTSSGWLCGTAAHVARSLAFRGGAFPRARYQLVGRRRQPDRLRPRRARLRRPTTPRRAPPRVHDQPPARRCATSIRPGHVDVDATGAADLTVAPAARSFTGQAMKRTAFLPSLTLSGRRRPRPRKLKFSAGPRALSLRS